MAEEPARLPRGWYDGRSLGFSVAESLLLECLLFRCRDFLEVAIVEFGSRADGLADGIFVAA